MARMGEMNLPELKELLRKLGGSPGSLRKADILALCQKMSGTTVSADASNLDIKDTVVIAKQQRSASDGGDIKVISISTAATTDTASTTASTTTSTSDSASTAIVTVAPSTSAIVTTSLPITAIDSVADSVTAIVTIAPSTAPSAAASYIINQATDTATSISSTSTVIANTQTTEPVSESITSTVITSSQIVESDLESIESILESVSEFELASAAQNISVPVSENIENIVTNFETKEPMTEAITATVESIVNTWEERTVSTESKTERTVSTESNTERTVSTESTTQEVRTPVPDSVEPYPFPTVRKQNVRALSPIMRGPQSQEQYSLPVIKGDLNNMSPNIVQNLGKIHSDKSRIGNNINIDSEFASCGGDLNVELNNRENSGENNGFTENNRENNRVDNNKNNDRNNDKNQNSNQNQNQNQNNNQEKNVNPNIREYIMGGGITAQNSTSTSTSTSSQTSSQVSSSSTSMEVRDISTGQRYWAHHPSGYERDDRLLEGQIPQNGQNVSTVGGPGSGLGEMDITFLGTASCVPSMTRGVSCIAYRYKSDVWLFDCGEGSQQQMQKSRIRPSKITKIFITHLHGDHSFGLPGVLCLIGQATLVERDKEKLAKRYEIPKYNQNSQNGNGQNGNQNSNNQNGKNENGKNENGKNDPEGDFVLDIYGPEGTRDFVRAAIQLTYSKIANPYRIHELKNVPNLYQRNHNYRQAPAQVRKFKIFSNFIDTIFVLF